ncbi:uncharacterized protein K460DRAFT_410383 [Cucurbitaria berberidis CBS 394.84]|uniref:F-box domain-containing protein n=1 Tax=Cucurbitaria berberidis CBS 394.84 TaxID=1168544 RepID=A0A9P4G8J1_9PLEO|nr:uncharacterized protein K460DRAFT_410383 [Cucurbitaria berberidis CBS 394.84]KAF1840990.1 hypothetical protein K460DRAFT_410383 [Cucurbitaria berberidis CBS 394.84]
MARFELLPAELQLQIFSYLYSSDVKAARAVSRKLRDNATPALFRTVVACARYQAMGAFQKVALHPVYPTYVKEIIFDGSVYEARLALYEHAYNHEVEELRGGSHWGKRSRWKRYQVLYQEQEDMKTSGVLLQTIARALEWMPNVSSIVYSPHPHLVPVEAKDMRDLVPRGTARSSSFPSYQMSNGFAGVHHPFRQLIGAIYLSKYAGIREFTVEAYQKHHSGTQFSLSVFDFPEAVDLQAGQHFFQHLTKLELNIALQESRSRMGGVDVHRSLKQLANLASLLTATKDLRHLAFHVANWKCSASLMYGFIISDEQPIFRNLGLRTTWDKLQSLSLEGIYADEKDFTDLIKRHKTTLRSLVFGKCSLCSGVWAEIVDEAVFGSMTASFVLDRVNEIHLPGVDWMTLSTIEKENWRYEGRLLVSIDGERTFINTNSSKKSVYDLRS